MYITTKMNACQALHFLLFFLFFSINATGQQITICNGDPVPNGWISIQTNSICFQDYRSIPAIIYRERVIQNLAGFKAGDQLVICNGDPVPGGWITIQTNIECFRISNTIPTTIYYQRVIEKIEGLPVGTALTICNDEPVPEGWITIQTNIECFRISNVIPTRIYYQRVIKKIVGLPPGTELNICNNDAVPCGWITISTSGECFRITNTLPTTIYFQRVIKKVEGLPIGTILSVCNGDAAPTGWLVTNIGIECFRITNTLPTTIYHQRTIQKINNTLPCTVIIPPVANAGNDITINLPTNSVTLNGSNSFDSDGTITGYNWTYVSGPTQFTIGASTNVNTSISNLAAGTYVFRLTVTDDEGATAYDDVSVIVNPATGILNYRFYQGAWNTLPNFTALTPVKSGTSPNVNINIRPSGINDNFGFVWEGNINITTPGLYTFETISDDGSRLYFNSLYSPTAIPTVDNDGLHSAQSATGTFNIPAAGSYPIAVTYFQKTGGDSMKIFWTGPGIPRQVIPDAAFNPIADNIAPSAPVNLHVVSKGGNFMNLDWDNSTDNIGVTAYDIYMGGNKKYTSSLSEVTADSLSPNTSYTFTVKARDFAGNTSAFSNAVTDITLNTTNGLNYKYYEGDWNSIPDFSKLTPVKTGNSLNVDIGVRPAGTNDHFGFVWDGYINIQTPGNYIFETISDDGSRLYFNSSLLLNNDGLHGPTSAIATVYVPVAGSYPISISYFENDRGESMEVYWSGPGIGRQLIPNNAFTTTGTTPPQTAGLNYKYYEGAFTALPNFNALTPVKTGTSSNTDITVRNFGVNDNFAFSWDGYIILPTAGTYTFETVSDDGSKLYFNTTYSAGAAALVNNDGLHAATSVTGSVSMAAGTYPIAITFFEATGGETMQVYWTGPGITRQLIPNSAFTTTGTPPPPPTSGLNYKYYEGAFTTLPNFNALTPIKTGISPTTDISVRNFGVNDNFAFLWQGYIHITTPGNYTFETVSDDGSKLYFNTTYAPATAALVNNDGLHAATSAAGAVSNLAAGDYPIAITYFEATGGETMQVYWTGPGISRQLIPASAFIQTVSPFATPNALSKKNDVQNNVAAEERKGNVTINKIYPNPFAESFYIDFYNPVSTNNITINISDLTGRSVYIRKEGNLPVGNTTLEIHMNNTKLAEGIYLVTLLVNGQPSKTMKLVKTK